MRNDRTVYAIIPALNEAEAIAAIVNDLHALRDDDGHPLIHRVIVADNGSTDGTGQLALAAGATVVQEPRRGYGYACMAGIAAAGDADVLLFVDGDNSVVIQETSSLLAAIDHGADLAIGSRINIEPGSMTFPQRFGNGLACFITRLLWHVPISDLGPFRAIRRTSLYHLDMKDMTYGWTVEMQIKAFQCGQHVTEVPVSIRCRIGRSKVSGTVRGVIGAGIGIFSMIAKLWWRERRRVPHHRARRV